MKLFLKSLAGALLLAAPSFTQAEMTLAELRDPELVRTFSEIPVQEGGRIKPLQTLAKYRLLRFHGTSSVRFENPETKAKDKLSETEWLLVTWFKPELSKKLPLFRVDNSAAVTEIGGTAKGRFDQYSYDELLPYRSTLMEKADEYRQLDAKARTPVQRMIAELGINFLDYEMIVTHWDMFRAPFGPNSKTVPEELTKALAGSTRIATLVPAVFKYVEAHPESAAPMSNPWMMDFMKGALGGMMSGNEELSLRIFPSPAGAVEKWHGPGWIVMEGLRSRQVSPEDLKWLSAYEEIFLARDDAAKFKTVVTDFASKVKAAADARSEAGTVALEASYFRTDYFYKALLYFGGGLLLVMLTWAVPGGRWEKWTLWGAWAAVLAGIGYSTVGIVIRCIIMQRGPISTLYETMLFIALTGALFGVAAEYLTKRRVGLLIATIAGVAGLLLSYRFETNDAGDTLVQLQAVLMTNFWLATHVPMINAGYAACLVASITSMLYLLMSLFPKMADADRRLLTRMSYGFLCAGLFLSLVGTILGGIWANDSWGRFWGWDPKENGALMIVLMALITLHARMGGYIREIGLHACNLVLGAITAFSWFGTNQLGVGLHAYGFTDGVWGWLRSYWALQGVLLLVALYLRLKGRKQAKVVTE